jgi:hypothetical protein
MSPPASRWSLEARAAVGRQGERSRCRPELEDPLMKPIRTVGIALFILFLVVECQVQACGFINDFANQKTMREEAADSIVLYGTLRNPRQNPDGSGTTELVIDTVIKSHPILGDKKVVELPRYVAVENAKEPTRYLVFCDVYQDKIDPYRGIPSQTALEEYVKGLLVLDGKDRLRLMRYCFDYLEHANQVLAEDAFLEFMKSPDADIGKVARDLPAEKIRGGLENPKTAPSRLRLYGFLLGNCGKVEDAEMLRNLAAKNPPNADGILTGHVLLKPKEGWVHVRHLLGDGSRDFVVRYQALRTAQFFYNTRSDVIAKKDVVDALSLLLDQPDIADLPIGVLRQWRCWDLTDRVLAVAKASTPNPAMIRVLRRAVVRYALQCPAAAARAFVAEQRKTNPEMVATQEELLREEANSPTRPPSLVR